MVGDLAVGFDFGTSNSAIAVLRRGDTQPQLLRLDVGRTAASLVPSTLYFLPDGTLHIGYDAIETFMRLEAGRTIRREMRTDGQEIETVFGLERVIQAIDVGKPGRFFQSLKRSLGDAAFHRTDVFGTAMTLEELIAAFTAPMRRRAEAELGEPVTEAVVGRPVRWAGTRAGDELARRRMEDALRLAGFQRFRFLEEPIAAGLRLATALPTTRTVLVFDFGGGTLDVTVMRVGGSQHDVLSTAGRAVGGNLLDEDVMDHRLLRYFGEQIRWGRQQLPMPQHILDTASRWQSMPELNDPRTLSFLRGLERERRPDTRRQAAALLSLARGNHGWPIFREIERAKIGLSAGERERIDYRADAIAIDEPLTRREFEELIETRVREAGRCIDDALSDAGLAAADIDLVLYTGGSSLIPRFQRLLTERFGAAKLREQDAFTSVASGLAFSAAQDGIPVA